jgi:hypothetical protein
VAQDVSGGTVHALAADVEVTLAGARVRLEYQLSGVGAGDRVPVSLLDFAPARAGDFRVGAAGAPLTLDAGHGAARAGVWPVEPGPDGRALLRVEYVVPHDVTDGADFVRHVPMLSVDRAPEAARPGLFRAEVRTPGGWRVSEGFPTGLTAGDVAGAYSVELAVVPAVLTLRGRTDGASGLSMPLVLDLVALAVLLLTAVVGWRHMRAP